MPLVPVGVGWLDFAGGIEFGYLLCGQVPFGCGEVLFELGFVAGADDDGRYGWPLQ